VTNVASRLAPILGPFTDGTPLGRSIALLGGQSLTLAQRFGLVIVRIIRRQRKVTAVICVTLRVACFGTFGNDHWLDNNFGWTSADTARLTTIHAHTSYSCAVAATQSGSNIRAIASFVSFRTKVASYVAIFFRPSSVTEFWSFSIQIGRTVLVVDVVAALLLTDII